MRRVNPSSWFPTYSALAVTATFTRGHIRRTSEEIFSAIEARFERIFDQIYSIKSNCYLVLGVESKTAHLRTGIKTEKLHMELEERRHMYNRNAADEINHGIIK